MNKENKNLYLAHAAEWDNRDILRISQTVSDVATYINRSDDPYLILEKVMSVGVTFLKCNLKL